MEEPESRRERIRGLRGRGALPHRHAMLIPRCRSVHTFGMAFTIDAVLLDRANRVVTVFTMRPRRLLLPRRGVRHILECAPRAGPLPGDRLTFTEAAAIDGNEPWGAPGYTLSAAP